MADQTVPPDCPDSMRRELRSRTTYPAPEQREVRRNSRQPDRCCELQCWPARQRTDKCGNIAHVDPMTGQQITLAGSTVFFCSDSSLRDVPNINLAQLAQD